MWENVEQGGGMTELSYYEWNQSFSISGSGRVGAVDYHLLCGNQSQPDGGI